MQHLGGRAGHLLAGGQGQGGDDVKADFKRQFPAGGFLNIVIKRRLFRPGRVGLLVWRVRPAGPVGLGWLLQHGC
ncbi:hypothetical protein FUT78_11780 [Xylella fastidiosa subsp. fastidiosa]|nr:hypothetical protein [Xylella fastidiosa subsp. fastidiosa]